MGTRQGAAALRLLVLLVCGLLGLSCSLVVGGQGVELTGGDDQADISFQIHSFNDLGLLPQLRWKRATWFKFDPHYMTSDFCTSQSAIADPSRGCLVLNHDRPVALRQYNTTDQLLALLNSTRWRTYAAQRQLHVALCFKFDSGSDICSDAQDASDWRYTVDQLFDRIAALDLPNVTFVLDGVAVPASGPCLINRWSPWNATYIVGQNPAQGALDNNRTNGDETYQINNMPASHPVAAKLQAMQAIDYGKFLGNGQPFLFWEPSDEPDIAETITTYANGSLSTTGFRFAINIDPLQIAHYASYAAGPSRLSTAFDARVNSIEADVASAGTCGACPVSGTILLNNGTHGVEVHPANSTVQVDAPFAFGGDQDCHVALAESSNGHVAFTASCQALSAGANAVASVHALARLAPARKCAYQAPGLRKQVPYW
ncbi:uncharacterized protein MONBRDRAFT_27889 [Monosiga brevicollis MX1]|uniref:Uncharacterized protein n=1 Tax=Monosiga brevicollis TaxID=81824 RepID=A9V6S0_MONBE|nr:uncharacterized protein MONBRDRAFT_27889 [Monosiga brevicollis MX1]EDQ86855.1 predicted protein [Monosiga brevicollis MX1]|eukprot:XP_001748400.1 hypothetical protein [Monosiga brevicollis MX1]